MPEKINCGVTKNKKGQRYGTAQECMDKGQVRYYGRMSAPADVLGEDLLNKPKFMSKAQKKKLSADIHETLEQYERHMVPTKEERAQAKYMKKTFKRLDPIIEQAKADETKTKAKADKIREKEEARAHAKEQLALNKARAKTEALEAKETARVALEKAKALMSKHESVARALTPHVSHDLHPDKCNKYIKKVEKLENENTRLQDKIIDMQNNVVKLKSKVGVRFEDPDPVKRKIPEFREPGKKDYNAYIQPSEEIKRILRDKTHTVWEKVKLSKYERQVKSEYDALGKARDSGLITTEELKKAEIRGVDILNQIFKILTPSKIILG